MPIPRPRFTVRWLMVAVAVVAVVLGWHEERRSRFGRLSVEHELARKELQFHDLEVLMITLPSVGESHASHEYRLRDAHELLEFIKYHQQMWVKYEVASQRPWFPVGPDPTPPPKPSREYVKRIKDRYCVVPDLE